MRRFPIPLFLLCLFVPAGCTDPADGKKKRIITSVNMVVPDEKGNMYIGSNGIGFTVQKAGSDAARGALVVNGAETFFTILLI